MKVLVACEESQTVCKAFRAKGHEAYSCDGLGFLPFAMLYRDETGRRDPEWKKFQREWANAVIVGRKYADFWAGKG